MTEAPVRPTAPDADSFRALANCMGLFCGGLACALFLTMPALALRPLASTALPLHTLGLLLLGTGAVRLRGLSRGDADGLAYANLVFVSVLIECYGLPFLVWWRKFPDVLWFRVNVILLSSVTCWLLMMLCGLAARVGLLGGAPALARVGRAAGWLMLLFLPLPAFLLAGPDAHAFESGWLAPWARSMARPWLIQSALSLPVLITLALLWAGRETCIEKARRTPRQST
jgi:hypothetical protein